MILGAGWLFAAVTVAISMRGQPKVMTPKCGQAASVRVRGKVVHLGPEIYCVGSTK